MNSNFMLNGDSAKILYDKVKDLPIFDYHCHLSPKEIFEDRVFNNLTELWLEADHYKWRVMRIAGIDEKYITGDASDYDKFFAFCKVLPNFVGNPVYHWAHLELYKYFNISLPINEDNAKTIWDESLKVFRTGEISAAKLIEKSKVTTVITTDDPIDDLSYHKQLKGKYNFEVLPSFRPDKVINIANDGFDSYIHQLEKASQREICCIGCLLNALEIRLDYFIKNGCVVCDTSFKDFPNKINPTQENAKIAFQKRMNHEELTQEEVDNYMYFIIKSIALMFSKKGITMQIHAGVVRNQNTTRFNKLGADCGIDSVANPINTENFGLLLDDIEKEGGLPRMIAYSLNNNDYYALATMLGNFAGDVSGKLQLGAAWWFMDHKDGITEQLRIFSNTMGIGYFNGMLTDSRSFVSYARHDYFRRVLCSVIGDYVDKGECPLDNNLIKLVQNICYYNAKNNFVKRED